MTTATAEAFYKALASPETKDLDLEWKVQRAAGSDGLYEAKVNLAGIVSADDDGIVDAIVSVTGILDEVEDVILPGAYTKTLTERIPKGVWSHDWGTWVSRTDKVAELLPDDPSLPRFWKGKPWPKNAGAARVRTAFNLGTQAGKDAYSNIKFFDAGPLGQQVEWSIGYNVPAGSATRSSQGWRLIKALKWYEYCPVLFGAMPLAGTLANDERKAAEMGEGKETVGTVQREVIVINNAPTPDAAKSIAEQVSDAVKGVLGDDEPTPPGLEVVGADWTPSDEELKALFAAAELESKVAGVEATPGDVRATDRLKHYWAHGQGAAKIGWGVAGDFDRCLSEVGKYMHSPQQAKGYCALRHHEATGFWPGHAPTEQTGTGHKGIEMGDTTATATATETKGTAPGTAPGSGDPSPESERTGGQVPAGNDEPGGGVVPAKPAEQEDEEKGLVDDDPENKWALPFDPPDDYVTGDDGDGAKALELKASGKMACGKSASDCPHTMGDDSYPVHNADEVDSAVKAYPRGAGKGGKTKADIRKHIVSRAKAVGATSNVPNTWPEKRGESKSAEEAIADAIERKDYPYLPGSVEERQDQLRDALQELLLPEPDAEGRVRAWVSLDGTYADRVVATLNDYSTEPSEEQTFVIPYTVGQDGEVAFAEPQAVDKVVQLVPDTDYQAPSGGDTSAATSTAPAGVLGGASPLLTVGRKITEQAKILAEALESFVDDGDGTKAAAVAEDAPPKPQSGTHVRRLRDAHRALTGALVGMGVKLPVTVMPAEDPDAAAADGDATKSLDVDDDLLARTELLLAEV